MFSISTALAVLVFLPCMVLGSEKTAKSFVTTLPPKAQELFNESMQWMDSYYDSSAGHFYDESATTALRHETRSSAWYAVGLFARNNGTDVAEALKILTNVISGQYKNPEEQWCAFNKFSASICDVGFR